MERFGVLIYEPSEEKRKRFHKLFVSYAISANIEVLIKWVHPNAEEKAVFTAGIESQAAFINTSDGECAYSIGKIIYRANHNCALIYYGFETPDGTAELIKYFRGMLPSRPVMYLDKPDDKVLYTTLNDTFEREMQKERFEWEARNFKYRIPYSNILYFRSDRNNVYIHLENGTEYSFYGKLAQIEERLPKSVFVRIHQSYLVNKCAINLIDKTQKNALLRNGETVYISRAHYKEALDV